MLITQFVELTRSMRSAQKNYFKTRTQSDLVKAKEMESEVDKALAEGVTIRATVSLGQTEAIASEEYQETFDLPARFPDEPDAGDL